MCWALFYILYIYQHLFIFAATLGHDFYYYFHFNDEEIEAQEVSNLPQITQLGSCRAGIHF